MIDWHIATALDPAVSSDAQALIEKGKQSAVVLDDERATFDEFMESWERTHRVSRHSPSTREAFENGYAMARAASPQPQAQTERALTGGPHPEWADCETRGVMVRNSLKHRIGELKTASNRLRKAYRLDFMRIPCEWLADAYDEAVAALESRASAVAAAHPETGADHD